MSSLTRFVSGTFGYFQNINPRLERIERNFSNLATTVNLDTGVRTLTAFAVSSQAAADKFRQAAPATADVDLTTVTVDGELYLPFVFAKSLKHDVKVGMAKKTDVNKLLDVIFEGFTEANLQALEGARAPGAAKFAGLNEACNFTLRGPDPQALYVSVVPQVKSFDHAAEMVEVYAQSLLRDVPFEDFVDSHESSDDVAGITLRVLSSYQHLHNSFRNSPNLQQNQGKGLFRGDNFGDLFGPYVSQFLLHRIPLNGGVVLEQRYQMLQDSDASVTSEGYLAIQQGQVSAASNTYENKSSYIYSGRSLGTYVHQDPVQYAYYFAALFMLNNSDHFPLQHSGTASFSSWLNKGSADLLTAIGDVAQAALKAACFSKYHRFCRLRPDALAQKIDLMKRETSPAREQFRQLLEQYYATGTELTDEVFARNNNYHLKQLYAEGSPLHASLPAGHAVVAGACVTLMKAFFKTHSSEGVRLPWPPEVGLLVSVDGDTLQTYDRKDIGEVTVVGELNKLVSNISIGRDWAGVHYRSDAVAGQKLGEDVAVDFLRTKLKEYNESYLGQSQDVFFQLETFDEEVITIRP